MGDKFSEGYFLSLLDDAERLLLSDNLGDEVPYVSYTLKDPEGKKVEKKTQSPLTALYTESAVIKINPKVLFFAPFPEGDMIFTPESLEKFRAWWKLSLLLEEGEWALTTLIKCPVGEFSTEAADECRSTLREEMKIINPEAMILLGHETASYMLRKDMPMAMLRNRKFVVNHIPVFVTYTPGDYLRAPSLQRAIWNDMLFIRKSIGTEDRKG